MFNYEPFCNSFKEEKKFLNVNDYYRAGAFYYPNRNSLKLVFLFPLQLYRKKIRDKLLTIVSALGFLEELVIYFQS